MKNKSIDDLYNTVFNRYYPNLVFYATRFLSEDEAEDVVQDVFVDLWKRRDQVELGDQIQAFVDSVLHSQYFNAPDGISGNEDCGQMSAWYVLNSMGFYQVCPGKPVYSIGRPLFDKATIRLPQGQTFEIITKNNSRENKYIESVTLNGEALNVPFFHHEAIAKGGTMVVKMTAQPTSWGSAAMN